MANDALLIRGLSAGYGAARALDEVSNDVGAGEAVALLGANGNSKSTLMRCILGLVKPWAGKSVRRSARGQPFAVGSNRRKSSGLAWSSSPKGAGYSRTSASKTISHLARIGGRRGDNRGKSRPLLRDLSASSGEAQATRRRHEWGRAANRRPRPGDHGAPEILIVDEPSVELAPIVVRQTIEAVAELKRRLGLALLIAEQNLAQTIRIVDRGYVLAHGPVAFEGRSAAELWDSPLVRDIYLGR